MKKLISFVLSITLLTTFLFACKKTVLPVTKTGLYFDTVISITLYENASSALIDDCFNIADRYEKLFSKTIPNSDIYKINNSDEWVEIDKETFDLINYTFKYEELSESKFSVVCGALVDLWDIPGRSSALINTNSPQNESSAELNNKVDDPMPKYNMDNFLPADEDIAQAIKLCGKDKLDIDEETCSVRINTPGAKLDLGAVAKGYVADKMKEYLVSQGVKSGIIQLGGNVLTIGNNPRNDNGHYSIGISKPFSNDSEVITSLSVIDTSVVTSGNYQRYFNYEGSIFHHIIDLTTGFPANTGLNSVTVECSSSTDADIMSTILFLEGKEKGAALVDSLNIANAIYIDKNNKLLD